MIARGYADVHVPPKELLAEIRANIRMRPGVEALATFCRGRGWHFAVVSHGLAFYIEALLPTVDTVHVVRRHVRRLEVARFAAGDDGLGGRRRLQEPRRR